MIGGAASIVGAVIDGIQQQVKDTGEGLLGLMDFDQNVRINRGKNTHLVNVLSSPTSSDQEVRDVLEERKHVFTQSTAAGLEFLATTPISVAMQARMAGITAGGMAAGDAAKLIEMESRAALKLESVVAKAATVVEKAEFAAASAAGTIEKAELAAGRAITKFEGAAAKSGGRIITRAEQHSTMRMVPELNVLQTGCLAAGTRLLTPESDKSIEEFQRGDWVLSSNEEDPSGAIVYQQVEEVFRNFGQVLLLEIAGRTIRTSGEHPYYVQNKGWMKAELLQSGDQLRSHDGRWNAVESVSLQEEPEPLYNLRVANHHTYFVGERSWGFSAWSHNTICPTGSGLAVVNRPNMALKVVKDVNGRQVAIWGQKHSSSNTLGHADAIKRLATQMAKSGDYEYVTMQRSWRTATGRVGTSRKIPDVIGVRRNGVVDAYEIISDSQTGRQLKALLKQGMDSLPLNRRGQFDALTPQQVP